LHKTQVFVRFVVNCVCLDLGKRCMGKSAFLGQLDFYN